jgi:hypothetical protein
MRVLLRLRSIRTAAFAAKAFDKTVSSGSPGAGKIERVEAAL